MARNIFIFMVLCSLSRDLPWQAKRHDARFCTLLPRAALSIERACEQEQNALNSHAELMRSSSYTVGKNGAFHPGDWRSRFYWLEFCSAMATRGWYAGGQRRQTHLRRKSEESGVSRQKPSLSFCAGRHMRQRSDLQTAG